MRFYLNNYCYQQQRQQQQKSLTHSLAHSLSLSVIHLLTCFVQNTIIVQIFMQIFVKKKQQQQLQPHTNHGYIFFLIKNKKKHSIIPIKIFAVLTTNERIE